MSLETFDPEDPTDAALQARSGGAIARLIHPRGFGFIVAQPTGKEHFFHITDVENVEGIYDLREGDQVSFVSLPGKPVKGKPSWRAEQIRVLSTGSIAGRDMLKVTPPRDRI